MKLKGRRSLVWSNTLALVLLVALGLLLPTSARTDPAGMANGDVIVIFRDGTDIALRHHVLVQAGAVARRHFQVVGAAAASLPHAGVRAFLERHPDVVTIVPDRPVYAYAKGGGAAATTSTQVVPAGVQRIGAAPANQLGVTGSGVGVAVVDTGLDFNHRDLKPLGQGCFTAYTAICQDDNSHGTHVGGIIAARNNTVDVVGVAPNATLYAVKVLNSAGSGTDSTIIAGLDWIATANVSPPIRVVNMSLGRPGSLDDDPALRSAVQLLYNKGISIVVAAGNDSSVGVSQQVPATYPEVMAVASTTAVNGTNQCAYFSGVIKADTASYFTTDGAFIGGIGVTISAPGEDQENITRSCYATSVGILSTKLGGGTTRLSGTSMAAPHVAGVVALMWQRYGTLTPEDARGRIRGHASRVGTAPLDSPTIGYTFDGEHEGIAWAPGATQ